MFVATIDQGDDGARADRQGLAQLPPGARDRKGPGQDLLRRGNAGDAVRRRLSAVNPGDFASLIDQSQPAGEGRSTPRDLRRAQEIFREDSPKSFVIDLGDLSRDAWTLLPGPGDFLAEIRTRRFDTLTYAQAGSGSRRHLASSTASGTATSRCTPSKQKLATRGRFYNEDDLVDYDVLDYDIDVAALPDRPWIEGRARSFASKCGRTRSAADAQARRLAGRASIVSASTAGCSASA